VLAAILVIVPAAEAHAQVGALESGCVTAGGESFACRASADIAEILTARALIIAEGGNPVPGAASTIGLRVPGMPRVGLTARLSAARIELPAPQAGRTVTSTGLGWNADVVVGLIDGIPAFETVGGIGSIDLLGSVGVIRLPSGEGFRSRSPFTWAAGARVGILRESFTVPGISLSGMFRHMGSLRHEGSLADPAVDGVTVSGTNAWSTRAVIGKRVATIGLAGGVGYTTLSTGAAVRVPAVAGGSLEARDDDLDIDRFSVFGSATWTHLVFSLTGELGWQSGGGSLEAGRDPASDASGGGLFLSLAGRLII